MTDIASALNGIGNVYHARDELEKAIRYYRLALELEPRYAYAWHDLFGAGDAMARKGTIDLEIMRESLAKVIETGAGQAGLSEKAKIKMMRSIPCPLGSGGPRTPEPKKSKAPRSINSHLNPRSVPRPNAGSNLRPNLSNDEPLITPAPKNFWNRFS